MMSKTERKFYTKRMIGLHVFFLMMVVLTAEIGFAQQSSVGRDQLERIIEQIVSDLDPEEHSLQILQMVEQLEELAANPLNINRAGADRLAEIPGLSFRQADAIVQYRSDVRPFEQLSDLLLVDGIGEVSFQQIRPFLTTGSSSERGRDLLLNRRYWTSNSRTEALSRVQTVLEEREGYTRPDSLGGYTGSPVKFNHRYRYRSRRISLNLSQDKDPGEPVSGLTGFDYTSWHASIHDAGPLKNLVAGDYRVSYGQGLILWTGGAFGKSSQVRGAALRGDTGIRPYTSSQETNAFRGVAATVGERLQISGFYSNRKRTASEVDEFRVNFPTQTGFHRTQNEIDRKNNLGQTTFGGRVRYRFGRGMIGISGYQNEFDRPVANGTQPYQVHRFSGRKLSAFSSDFRFHSGPAILFGEAAYTDNGGTGWIAGSEYRPAAGTDISLAYRNYSADFQSIFGAGFGEQSSTQNEEGFYIGIQQQAGEYITLLGYIDQFSTHSARFSNHRPTSGFDWLARAEVEPRGDLYFYLQFRLKRQEQEFTGINTFGRESRFMGSDIRSTTRVHAEYRVHPSVRLRTRFDVVRARPAGGSTSHGFLIYQDLRLTPSSAITADFRITLFDTEDFNARVFQFENDLLYVMSNTMMFDQGQRIYGVLRYQPSQAITLRMKAATTLYENRTTIGSGLDEIRGNRRTDIGFQVQIQI
ncbi:hypothetical protein DYD21_17260 [Rhodohalobacter sp. SW132]|uniref:ComEA family DNA-binding protein n=1 Tax=Rhodohalobacter sp. SW132 TaxID=2293433 RepID=UPI000E23C30C|nr:helix-hairpin-helix domain-containing protein [Rhodohalobacter sp. SW132]REL24614.1 hypothetical protein DYD21_17260 [Rhodohalobacter sp. SW132]